MVARWGPDLEGERETCAEDDGGCVGGSVGWLADRLFTGSERYTCREASEIVEEGVECLERLVLHHPNGASVAVADAAVQLVSICGSRRYMNKGISPILYRAKYRISGPHTKLLSHRRLPSLVDPHRDDRDDQLQPLTSATRSWTLAG